MINVTKTYLPPLEDYQKYLKEIWDNNWITNRGKFAQELESKLCQFLEIEKLLFVSSGTVALQIAIKALELKGEIITTPFSYVATTSSIVWQNCEPVFVDIDEKTLCINPNLIEKSITQNTKAILATHVYGIPCDVEKIENIAQKHNLKVIYDAAHCFGIKYKNQSLLNYGDISTLSFQATKLFHTAEGGGIVVKDEELFHKIFYHHNFGHKGQENFWGLGINGKASELNAALGLCLLPYINDIVEKRKQISQAYDKGFENTSVRTPIIPEETEYNYAYYPIILPTEHLLLHIQKKLNEQNIFPRRYFYPSLNTLNYVKKQPCPNSENIAKRVLCLPLFKDLSMRNLENIIHITKQNL